MCIVLLILFLHSENNCDDGDLRLIGGLVDSEGTVEICQSGGWSSLCPRNWGYQDKLMVCNKLQLPTDGKTNHLQHDSFTNYTNRAHFLE